MRKVRKILGLNPIIATVFLIIAAVVVGAMFLGWQMGWFKSTARTADISVTAEIIKSSSGDQMVITVKNVGTVKVYLVGLKIPDDSGPDGASLATSDLLSQQPDKAVDINNDGTNDYIYLDPGESLSFTASGSWTSGSSYLVTVYYIDDLGNTLVKTISVQA